MSTPGFTAETSLYKTAASYTSVAAGFDRFSGGLVTGHIWTSTFGLFADKVNVHGGFLFAVCGGLGQSCCRAPIQNVPAFGPVVSCDQGLGCDVETGKCVSPCGGPGQACCDGPQTRAPKWTADGRLYSPNFWNMQEMCDKGACDRQSHRCFTCGTQEGGPCCPPDAAQATARCMSPILECDFDPLGFAVSGTCRRFCGIKGKEPCSWGCDPGLGIRNGLCDICGGDSQPPCDNGCGPGLGQLQGLCRHCGNAGQIPCDGGCFGGLKPANGLCAVCGAQGQPPCDAGCNPGTRLTNGMCVLCGYSGQPPCTNGCIYPMKVAGGVCRICGANGQISCDTGCNQGLVVRNGFCATPQSPPPDSCANLGEACVPEWNQGTHCCQHAGPARCIEEKCVTCIPHGEPAPGGGPQICCSPGEVPIWDQFLQHAVCGIPSPPDK
jgi:hypothetical protein